MKWQSHKILTGAIVFCATGNLVPTVGTVLGSVFPDAIEGMPTQSNYNAWRAKHRKKSHWFIPYLFTFLLLQSFNFLHPIPKTFSQLWRVANSGSLIDALPIVTWLVAMLALGALFHIAEDAICGKVPGIELRQKIGIKLFQVGSAQEYLLVSSISFALIMARVKLGM